MDIDLSDELYAKRYARLDHADFDAIVTGELTHYAIWLEDVLIEVISDYFARPSRKLQFKKLLLRRDGLTFQDKIEIVRAMLPEFKNSAVAQELKQLLTKVENFKSSRNAFAHGHDITPTGTNDSRIHVEIVNRAGKEKIVVVTPESHSKALRELEQLLKSLESVKKRLHASG